MNTIQNQLLQTELARFKTNHILHLLLSCLTLGIWMFFWMIVASNNITNRNKFREQLGLEKEPNTPAALFFLFVLLPILYGLFQ